MRINRNLFNKNCEHGGMMVELLLTLSLVAVALPFMINFHKSRIERAEAIAIAREMEAMQAALERYIDVHKKELMAPVGKNITRVKVTDLEAYGAPTASIEKHGDKFQMRVLKSSNRAGQSTLQGVVVLNDKEISPMRTREIINMGGDRMGFVEDGKAFGAFGTWRANTSDLGIQGDGIVETTKTTLGDEEYLWRLPSENSSDATMLSPLNMASHNIINAKFADGQSARFEEILSSNKIVSDRITFQARTTIDKNFEAADATVAGILSADSRSMEVMGTLSLSDVGKFSSFTADDLWVNNLNLSGLSISTSSGGKAATLKVSQTIDMVAGHITAMYASVGFTGSVTPKLVVKTRIEDSTDASFFWDITSSTARFADISFAELHRMAPVITRKEADNNTISGKVFSGVATNKNATASDFMNAIEAIQERVTTKYHLLNLE